MTSLIQNALKAITLRTNLSTGLSHENDENAAKEMFLRLHNAGEILLANEISAWAKVNGWREKDADELGALGQQIGMGENVVVDRGPWWNDDILPAIDA